MGMELGLNLNRQSGDHGTVDYRNPTASPRKPDNFTNHCRGVSHVVLLLRFCALGSGVNFVRVGKIKFWPWAVRVQAQFISLVHDVGVSLKNI
jgi:hypothetical protein